MGKQRTITTGLMGCLLAAAVLVPMCGGLLNPGAQDRE